MGVTNEEEIKQAKFYIPLLLGNIKDLRDMNNMILYVLYLGELLVKCYASSTFKTSPYTAGKISRKYHTAKYSYLVEEVVLTRNRLMHGDIGDCCLHIRNIIKILSSSNLYNEIQNEKENAIRETLVRCYEADFTIILNYLQSLEAKFSKSIAVTQSITAF